MGVWRRSRDHRGRGHEHLHSAEVHIPDGRDDDNDDIDDDNDDDNDDDDQERCDWPGGAGDPAPGQRHRVAGGHEAECAGPGGGHGGHRRDPEEDNTAGGQITIMH